jgi:hypothetical protein
MLQQLLLELLQQLDEPPQHPLPHLGGHIHITGILHGWHVHLLQQGGPQLVVVEVVGVVGGCVVVVVVVVEDVVEVVEVVGGGQHPQLGMHGGQLHGIHQI